MHSDLCHRLPSRLQQTNTLCVAGVAVGNGFLEVWNALGIQARRASRRRWSFLTLMFTRSVTC